MDIDASHLLSEIALVALDRLQRRERPVPARDLQPPARFARTIKGTRFMTAVLRIDASSRDTASGSVSRAIGDHLQEALLAKPGTTLKRRDIAASPLPHISQMTIGGFNTLPDQMTDALREANALSDELIAELRSADVLLLTVPMYNFSIPSALKAWIDQIVRIGHAFAYDGTSFAGLLTGKKAYIACAYDAGGYAPGQPLSIANFTEPYLRFLLGFLGFGNVAFFSVEATTGGEEVVRANSSATMAAIDNALAAA
jgi:FMN-dependent NADH-azoreductase